MPQPVIQVDNEHNNSSGSRRPVTHTRDVSTLVFQLDVGWWQTDGPDHIVESGLLFELYESHIVSVGLAIIRLVHENRLCRKISPKFAHLGKIVLAKSHNDLVRLETIKKMCRMLNIANLQCRKNIRKTCLSTQWLAVRTCWSVMSTPPQYWSVLSRSKAAIQGHSPVN